ncbi:hypothetical protein CDCA_CDCA18G4524 [Cyanidium caldarium]|uniref:DNA polymerase eta n=1 Tax=Cyanidium caldarium TaxID=2771 RepID=A0AAV9J1Y3_CYACA|nr:hypothetical protein CDCA_CDCA18G4524 [Cyanidium caldarium]
MFRGYDDAAKGDDDRGEDGVPAELVLRLAHGSHMAERLRAHIRRRTGLTTSAGIAPNKMLAKFGANMNKPDSQTTYLPTRGADRWLQSLPLRCFPGVGRSLARHLRERLGVTHAHHIRRAYASAAELAAAFERAGSGASTPPWPGRAAILLWDAVHGIHNEPVVARGLPRSISAEDSFVSMRPFSVAMRDKLGELVAECSERIEQDVQCNRRWPTRMAVKWRLAGQQRAAKGAMLSEAYREALAAGCRDVATPEVNHARQLFFEACWHLLQVAVGASEGASLTLLGVGVSNFEGHRRGNARKSGEGERCQNGRIDVLLRKRSHGEAAARRVACPLCGMFVDEYDNSNLNRHIDSCLQGASAVGDSRHSEMPEKLAGGGARRRLSVTLDAWVKRTRKRE